MSTIAEGGAQLVHRPKGFDNVDGMQMAGHKISEHPRIVNLNRCPTGGFGFDIIGDGPFFVHHVYASAKVRTWLPILPHLTYPPTPSKISHKINIDRVTVFIYEGVQLCCHTRVQVADGAHAVFLAVLFSHTLHPIRSYTTHSLCAHK